MNSITRGQRTAPLIVRHARARPSRKRRRVLHRHRRAVRRPNRNAPWIEAILAKDVDPEMIERGAFAVEDIDAALSAEIVFRATGVPLVEREELSPSSTVRAPSGSFAITALRALQSEQSHVVSSSIAQST